MLDTAALRRFSTPATLREVLDVPEERTRRTSRTLLIGGAFPRHQGLDETPDGLGEGIKDPLRRRRLSVDGASSRRSNVVGDGGAISGDLLDGDAPSGKTRFSSLERSPTVSSAIEGLREASVARRRGSVAFYGDAGNACGEPSSKLLACSASWGPEGLKDKIRRRRQSVGGPLRVQQSSSSSPERLKIEEFANSAAMTIRSPGFVAGKPKLFPLTQRALRERAMSLPLRANAGEERALSVDGARSARAASSPERLNIDDALTPGASFHSAATTISPGTSFVSSAKKHLPPSPGSGSWGSRPARGEAPAPGEAPTPGSPNSQFEFRRTQQDLPPSLDKFCPLTRQSTKLDVAREVEWVRDSLREATVSQDHGVLLGVALAFSLDHSLVRGTG